MTKGDPILLRAFKKESELEVWKQGRDGNYELLKTYPMCRWSGQLGPKVREGDRQVPEGYYAITPAQMNPNSNYYLSVNVGYPNQLDRSYGRNGALIMIHGACSSAGCFSMTDEQIADLYALMREAFNGGQKQIQFQSFPFRLSATNMAKYRLDSNMPFWKNLKEGNDHFEVTKREPAVATCNRKYVFNARSTGGAFDAGSACPPMEVEPSLAQAVSAKRHSDDVKVAELVSAGERAVRRLYKDGDQHPVFREKMIAAGGDAVQSNGRLQAVSQTEALAIGAVEIPVEEAKGARQLGNTLPRLASAEPRAPLVTPGVASAAPATASQALTPPTAFAPAEPAKTARPFYSGFLGLADSAAKDEPAEALSPAPPASFPAANVPLPPQRNAGVSVPARFISKAQAVQ